MHELKIYRGFMCSDTKEWWKICRGIDLSFQNWHDKFDKFWRKNSKVSKLFILMGSFWAKYILFELKKYTGVIFNDTEEWCKIWRETDSLFQNWHCHWIKKIIWWKFPRLECNSFIPHQDNLLRKLQISPMSWT